MSSNFEIGDRISKPKGYSFDGEVRAVFTNRAGETRIVAELIGDNGGGMLHIFSPAQLCKTTSTCSEKS